MKSKILGPRGEKIVNRDDSVTNEDSNNNLQNGKQAITQGKSEKVLTKITDNDTQGVLADENTSNKGQGPSGENL